MKRTKMKQKRRRMKKNQLNAIKVQIIINIVPHLENLRSDGPFELEDSEITC